MKTMASVIALSLLFLCGSSASGQTWLGGTCTYDDYPGACEIVSVLKTEDSAHQAEVGGGPGYEGYEVSFVFSPDEPMNLTENWDDLVFGREHLLQLCNSWYPGPRFLEKYNITEGAVFNCTLKLIAGGTCSPIVFEFDEIDQCDYFESSSDAEDESSP